MSSVSNETVCTKTIVLDETLETNGVLTVQYSGTDVSVTLTDLTDSVTVTFSAEGFAKFEQALRTP
jgi:hypothetical protein